MEDRGGWERLDRPYEVRQNDVEEKNLHGEEKMSLDRGRRRIAGFHGEEPQPIMDHTSILHCFGNHLSQFVRQSGDGAADLLGKNNGKSFRVVPRVRTCVRAVW